MQVMVNLMPTSIYPMKEPRHLLNTRLNGPWTASGLSGEKNIPDPYQNSNLGSSNP
jgi:hypothetical protein